MYPQFVCCRYKYRKYIGGKRRSRNLLNPQKGRGKMFMERKAFYVYVGTHSARRKCIKKTLYRRNQIDQSIKPKMKMNDCKWFFHFSCGGFFSFFDKYGWVFSRLFSVCRLCEIFKSKKIFSADFVWILFCILCEDRHGGMVLFVCIMYEVEVFFIFFFSASLWLNIEQNNKCG